MIKNMDAAPSIDASMFMAERAERPSRGWRSPLLVRGFAALASRFRGPLPIICKIAAG